MCKLHDESTAFFAGSLRSQMQHMPLPTPKHQKHWIAQSYTFVPDEVLWNTNGLSCWLCSPPFHTIPQSQEKTASLMSCFKMLQAFKVVTAPQGFFFPSICHGLGGMFPPFWDLDYLCSLRSQAGLTWVIMIPTKWIKFHNTQQTDQALPAHRWEYE